MKTNAAILLFAATAAAAAADLPDLLLPEGVGVNIHFTRGHERDLDLIRDAGFKFIRMDFGWASTERQRGDYDWSAYDELTANLDRRGLRPLYILDYSNPLYEETVTTKNPINGQEHKDVASPQHPESVEAFARWAAAAAKHFAGRRVIWEIWNEPNITFWKPKPDPQQYNTLAFATVAAVRAADPQATVIGPATSEVPEKFLEAFLAAGAPNHFDAISVHPYRPYRKGPETAAEDYLRLRSQIERHASTPERKQLPIISGEWGYSTFQDKGVSPETQAAFLVRQQLANLSQGIPISIWYDWKDDGPDPAEREHRFGIVTQDLRPKPAYLALQVMIRELRGFRIEERFATEDRDWVLLLRNAAGDPKLAAWTTDPAPHPLVLRWPDKMKPATRLTVTHGDGSTGQALVENGALHLTLSPLPHYLKIER